MTHVTKNMREARLVKKQSCRMTPQEREIHKEAGKYRRMTDQQLMDTIQGLKRQAEKADAREKALAAGWEDTKRELEKVKRERKAPAGIDEKAAVEKFLQYLSTMAGTGNGIGNGTIFKLRRILADMP